MKQNSQDIHIEKDSTPLTWKENNPNLRSGRESNDERGTSNNETIYQLRASNLEMLQLQAPGKDEDEETK